MHFHALYMLNSCTQPEVMGTIWAFICLMKTQWGCLIAIFKLDSERASQSAFHDFCKEEGIEIIKSLPYLFKQNSPIEHAGWAILNYARSLMIDANLLKDLWPKAYKATIYMLNQIPTCVLNLDKLGESEWIIPLQCLLFLAKGYIMHPKKQQLPWRRGSTLCSQPGKPYFHSLSSYITT